MGRPGLKAKAPHFSCVLLLYFLLSFALKKSLFRKAMWLADISFGHTASHSYSFVQLPNPSSCMVSTIAIVRRFLSGWPWGSTLRCLALALTNNIAEAFLQDATHAPQPMQAAASIASSAKSCAMGIALASGADPVLTDIYPPACMIRSKAERSTHRSRTMGNALARHGSIVMVDPLVKLRI